MEDAVGSVARPSLGLAAALALWLGFTGLASGQVAGVDREEEQPETSKAAMEALERLPSADRLGYMAPFRQTPDEAIPNAAIRVAPGHLQTVAERARLVPYVEALGDPQRVERDVQRQQALCKLFRGREAGAAEAIRCPVTLGQTG